MKFLIGKKIITGLVALLAVIFVSYFFDKGLSVGLGVLLILSCITFFALSELGFKDKKIYWLFFIVLALHLITTLFMFYAHFQPFSGGSGDYVLYQKSALEAYQSFKQGDFSIKDIVLKHPDFYTGHYYPAVVGLIYTLTLPKEIIGLLFNVWLAAVTMMLVYLTALELGALEKNAFIIGLVTAFYPTYLFDTGLLLKESLEICFIVLGLLFLIRIIKKFSWYNFLVLYIAIVVATHFRFYVGYALIIAFVISWFLLANMNIKKRALYGILFIALLGFVPQFVAGQGYYGTNSFETYLNPKMVYFYRQIAYNPAYRVSPDSGASVTNNAVNPARGTGLGPDKSLSHPAMNTALDNGIESSFVAKSTPLGFATSFMYVILGPFPWQIKNARESLSLVETIPWYLLLFFIVEGLVVSYKKREKGVVPLLIFSAMVLVVMTIFNSNFGIITRIRIPAFIALLCIAPLGFNENNIIYKYLFKIYVKIFGDGRGGVHREQLG